MTPGGISFRLERGGASVPVQLPVFNRVMVANALLAAAVGGECGLTLEEIARGLEAVSLPGGRMQVVEARGAWIINDAYNANPSSMKAALIALKEFPGASRRVAGARFPWVNWAGMRGISTGRSASSRGDQGVQFLVAVGPHAEAFVLGAMNAGLRNVARALDAEEAAVALKRILQPGDAILVKGSHFMGLEKVVEAMSGKGAA